MPPEFYTLLYFARDLLIPLALAGLLTFLLAPLVTRLERWIGRIAAVLLVVDDLQRDRGGRLGAYATTRGSRDEDLHGSDAPTLPQATGKPGSVVAVPASAAPTQQVQVVETSAGNPLQLLQVILSPLLGPLGTAGLHRLRENIQQENDGRLPERAQDRKAICALEGSGSTSVEVLVHGRLQSRNSEPVHRSPRYGCSAQNTAKDCRFWR